MVNMTDGSRETVKIVSAFIEKRVIPFPYIMIQNQMLQLLTMFISLCLPPILSIPAVMLLPVDNLRYRRKDIAKGIDMIKKKG